MRPIHRTVLAAAATAVLLSGCLVPSIDDPGSNAYPTDEPSVRVTESKAVPMPTNKAATGDSLEGKFSYATMDQYVDAVVPMITQWLRETWPSDPLPRVYFVPRGAEGPEGCTSADGAPGLYSSSSYEYCGADEAIYVGQDLLWQFYTETGDAGPAVGLAHEFGHHIQTLAGVPQPQTAAASVRIENQADCIAGAWTRYTDEQKWLEYPDDIEDIDALFPIIGSAEGPDRDHGTAQERMAAFETGFQGHAQACNSFFPNTPIIG